MAIAVGGAVLPLVLVVAALLMFRFGLSLEGAGQRVTLVVVIVLVAVYFLPRLVQTTMDAYRIGAEIRERQGR